MLTKLKNNISIIFLTISLLALLYVFFRAEFIHDGQKLIFYLKYYMVSVFLILLSFISFFINKRLKYKIAIFFFFLIILFYLIELIILANTTLEQFKKNNYLKNYSIKMNYNIDQHQPFNIDKFNSYKVFKKKYKNLTIAIDPYHFLKTSNQTLMPLSGISNAITLQCNELGYSNIYQTDKFGFNNKNEYWDNDFIDFFIVGGRFAHGDCVYKQKNIAGNINLFSGLTTINAGQGGSGPLMSYATLREYLPISKTKRVVWIYSESSDLIGIKNSEGLTEELKNDILNKYLLDLNFSQNLINRQNEIDEIVYSKMYKTVLNVDENLKHKRIFKFLKFFETRNKILTIYNSINKKNLKILQTITPKFKRILIKSKEFAENNGAEFYFVYLTKKQRYNNKNFDINENDYDNLIKFIKISNIKLINIHKELFANYDNPLDLFAPTFRNETAHYNEEGYMLVSKAILKKINDYEKLN